MSDVSRPPRDRALWLVLLLAVTVLYGFAVIRAAWIGDDALITMRVVDNFVHGDGLRWNIADRVQISIHPLWMFCVSAVYAVVGDATEALLGLSAVCLIGMLVLFLKGPTVTLRGAVTGIALLGASKAFVDYSTSGLENPLTALLLTWMVVAAERVVRTRSGFVGLSLAAGLIVLNRLDQAVVVLPVLLVVGFGLPWRRVLGGLVIGFAPLALWLVFATIYYGSPIAIIGHAKLISLGVPKSQLAAQSLNYFQDSLFRDPVTLIGIVGGLVLAFAARNRLSIALGIASLASLAYIVRVGGDFMTGRFFVTPVFVGALLIARSQRLAALGSRLALAVPLLFVAMGFLSRPPTLLSPTKYDGYDTIVKGVVDERAHYYGSMGLLSPSRRPPVGRALEPLLADARQGRRLVNVHRAVGYVGFVGGRELHIVDTLLTDPLLARLPVARVEDWLPAHGTRRIPEGYLATVATGENRLKHPGLRRYYDRLRLVVEGPIWSGERWMAMWELWTDDSDLQQYIADDYFKEPRKRWPLSRFVQKSVDEMPWHDERALILPAGGVVVDLPARSNARAIQIGLDALDTYRFRYMRAGEAVGEVDHTTTDPVLVGIRPFTVTTPKTAVDAGFDSIHIEGILQINDGIAAIGAIELLR